MHPFIMSQIIVATWCYAAGLWLTQKAERLARSARVKSRKQHFPLPHV